MATAQVTDPRLVEYARVIEALHREWEPHDGQIPVGRALFRDDVRQIFIQCGRKWGKTETVLYMLWRWAMTNPGSSCYYISPFQKQSKEIVWANRRLQNFGPREWLKEGSSGINNSELRLNFVNGSFIKCDGSDNFDAYRGIEPHFVVYEEFKDFRPEFHTAMDPNLAVFNAPLIIIGTPPDRECQFTQLADEFKNDPAKRWFHAPTWQNPHISKVWLEKKKREHYAKNEGDVWEREYGAKFVKGGASKIFPMIDRARHVRPHAAVMKEIERDRRKLVWMQWNDPAAASCFASLWIALNPYTKRLYALDEIYETDQAAMSVRQIGRRIIDKNRELCDRAEWRMGYDEAETWWATEFFDAFQEYMEPSQKALHDKESGLSLVKDILLKDLLVISDRCEKLFWELDNYFKDKKGKIPKTNDHLIDDLRYILGALNYSLTEEQEYVEAEDEDFRGSRISDDFPGLDDLGRRTSEWEDWN
jgi:hypothetical protein